MAVNVKLKPISYALALPWLTVVLIASVNGRAQTDSQTKPAEQVYRNIQVLNGIPAGDVDGIMNFMSAALGVGCTHCHVNPWDGDQKSTKLAARKMITMTRSINKENFSGN